MRVRRKPQPVIRLINHRKTTVGFDDKEINDYLAYYINTSNEILLTKNVNEDNILPLLIHEYTHWAIEMYLDLTELGLIDDYYRDHYTNDMDEDQVYKLYLIERVTIDIQHQVEA